MYQFVSETYHERHYCHLRKMRILWTIPVAGESAKVALRWQPLELPSPG
jgi:hypothetical protein